MSSNEASTTCPNCGAEFMGHEPKCPYCGTLNPSGAEAAYMDKLEDLRQDTDDLDDAAMGDFKGAVLDNGKSIARVMVIALIVIIALIALENGIDL